MSKKFLSEETREKYISSIIKSVQGLSDGRLMELRRIINDMYICDHSLEFRALFMKELEKSLKEKEKKES